METPFSDLAAPSAPDPVLREYLASRNAACPNCQYNLRGITVSACPECNHSLRLQLVGHDPLSRVNWVGWTTIALALASGVIGLVQWVQIFSPPFNSGMLSAWPLSTWLSITVHSMLLAFGVLWIIFALTHRHWPTPRPPVGSPLFISCVWLLVSSSCYLLTSLLRAFGL